MPASSNTDQLLAKAEPISDGGSASGITELRREKNPQTQQKTHKEQLQPERGVRVCERNNSTDTRVSEGGREGAPGVGAEIPLQPVEKTMVRQTVPLQPVEVHGGADIHLQPVEVHGGADIHLQPMEDPTPEQVETPEGGCDPVGSLHWSKLLAGPVAPWREEPRLEQVCWQETLTCGFPRGS
ncbi:acid sphingomyelinase-like phosphodiesterase 3b [Grus japonensis]|uniref:Acid sphingomyelinase-like phosphodiesterase 3b n=1 Tax=Grus japonensis TaxID=30415 RepID=A0ABC9Y0D0_GRUJA